LISAALDGRIRSMATTHELLSSHRWHGVSLTELVQRALAPYATGNNTEIDGPDISLEPEVGQAMAMVLHELATNAAKYGALSTKTGRVSIRWDRLLNGHPRSHLAFEWQEIGGPPVVAPGKSSYGTSTIRDPQSPTSSSRLTLCSPGERPRCRPGTSADCLNGDPALFQGDSTTSPQTGKLESECLEAKQSALMRCMRSGIGTDLTPDPTLRLLSGGVSKVPLFGQSGPGH
jgi:hypothetical protein